jgi:acetate CoA/acetoacetate CoA-transferase alpha subunit
MLQVITPAQAANLVHDEDVVMIGGFLANGTPLAVIDALLETPVKDLTVIANDTAYPESGIGKLIVADRIKKVIASHIGTNPITGQRMNSGAITVELVPQGTLAERIRSGGAGLGGVLTPTGVGTMVADGKQTVTVDGRLFLLETPLRARIALLKAQKGDKEGNLVYNYSSRNFNPLMAAAADIVIAQVDEIVEAGAIDPNYVHTPGIFVDYLVK